MGRRKAHRPLRAGEGACASSVTRSPCERPIAAFAGGCSRGSRHQPRPRFLNRHSRRPMQRAPRGVPLVARERSPGPPECEVTSLARRGRIPPRHQNVS